MAWDDEFWGIVREIKIGMTVEWTEKTVERYRRAFSKVIDD